MIQSNSTVEFKEKSLSNEIYSWCKLQSFRKTQTKFDELKLSLLSDAAAQQMEGQRKRKRQPDLYSFFKK